MKIGALIRVEDSSGAKWVKVFHLLKKKTCPRSRIAIGDIVKGSVKKHRPSRKIKRKSMVEIIIIQSKKKRKSFKNVYNWNSQCLAAAINKKNLPIGNKIKCRVSKYYKSKFKKKKWQRLRSISRGFI